ncbi:MAG TPA: prolipoprotein diacylglyceryl transferase family protein, partial [Anaerolineales bacterium]|nr:prolipoprotein diacylglyceryl transferase family protein [Anaerolineales bacterium]
MFGITFTMHWYGLIIAISVMIGTFIAEREIVRRGGQANHLWDSIFWIVLGGIVGARLWFVLNDIAGGGTYFTQDFGAWFRVWEGGLHIWGAVAGGLVAARIYCNRTGFSFWLLLDSLAIPLLVAQAFGRIGNFINQELYGPPTDLPWGVTIS